MNFFFRNNCLLAVAFDWLVFLILSVLFHSTNMRSSMRFLTFLLSTDLTRLTALSIVAVFRKNEISKKKKKPRANNQKQGPRERMKGANKKCGLFFIQNDNKIIKPCLETCYRVCQPDFTRSVPSKPPHTLALFTLFFFGRAPREFKQHTRFFDDHLLF